MLMRRFLRSRATYAAPSDSIQCTSIYLSLWPVAIVPAPYMLCRAAQCILGAAKPEAGHLRSGQRSSCSCSWLAARKLASNSRQVSCANISTCYAHPALAKHTTGEKVALAASQFGAGFASQCWRCWQSRHDSACDSQREYRVLTLAPARVSLGKYESANELAGGRAIKD